MDEILRNFFDNFDKVLFKIKPLCLGSNHNIVNQNHHTNLVRIIQVRRKETNLGRKIN